MTDQTRRTVLVGLSSLALAGCAGGLEGDPMPEGQFLTIDGRKLHYVARGKGPALILIHGASGNLGDWTFQHVDDFAKSYRVFAMDRPGLGLSDPAPQPDDVFSQARVIRAAAQQLGIGRATVVGHSYGGSVALAYALDNIDDVSGMVLLSSPTHVWPGSAGGFYTITNTPVVGTIFSNLVPALASDRRIKSAVSSIFSPQAVPDGYVEHIRPELALRPAAFRRNAAQVGALKEQLRQMTPRYPTLTMPIELLHGDRDETVSFAIHAQRFVRDAPNARLSILEGVGHMPHHAAPDALKAALARLPK